jgi:hypothetical protein
MENKTKITKEIKDFCKNNRITEKQFFGQEGIKGDLDLRRLTSLPEGFNPVVGGDLDLRSLKSLPAGFNPIVGGNLDLYSVTSLPKGFNPVVARSLCLLDLTSLPTGFNPVVGESLYLHSVTSLPEGFNPVVGGNLELDSLTSLPEGFSPVVCDDLHLLSLTSLPDGFNPNVGGYLYLENDEIEINSKNIKKIIEFKEGKYIKCNGIFTEVISRRKNIYKVKKINQEEKEFFLIVEGEFSAHGDTLKEAKKDLEFKILRDKIKKEPIYPDTMITVDRYRAITGACSHGVQMWLEENKITEKEMRAKDILPILQETNAYAVDYFLKLYVNKK